jgi:antirestriction protein ArdC
MPWHRDTGTTMPTNALTGSTYNGVNVIALWAAAENRGFTTGYWATYKQWSLLGGQVRKGEKGSVIVFYKQSTVEVSDVATGAGETKSILYARSSRVFNVAQVDGWQPPRPAVSDPVNVRVEAERFVRATSADIRVGGDRAYYRPATDHIQMPDRDRFTGTETIDATESYYATLLHELTHWTGKADRLDRDLSGRFGHEGYAMEELVAELGAAFLCSDLGITNRPRPDHAAYIAHWLAVLTKDTRAIFTAASKASEARRFLAGLQPAR